VEILLIILFAPVALFIGMLLLQAVISLIVGLLESKLFWGGLMLLLLLIPILGAIP
jgi:hypothetical protein